jgi:WD40 repeat protein
MAFSDDGRRLAALSYFSPGVFVFDTSSSELCCVLSSSCGTRYNGPVAFSPDGEHIAAVCGNRGVHVWDVATGIETATVHTAFDTRDSAFSPDLTRWAVGTGNDAVLIDMGSGLQAGVLRGHTAQVTGVSFSPNGEILASASRDGTIRVWNWHTGIVAQVLECSPGNTLPGIRFSSDGAYLVEEWGLRSLGSIWRTGDWKLVEGTPSNYRVAIEPFVNASACSGRLLVALDAVDWSTRLWDIEAQTASHVLDVSAGVDVQLTFAFSRDGTRLAMYSTSGHIRVVDANTGERIATFGVALNNLIYPGAIAFSPDGALLLAASENSALQIWDVTALLPAATVPFELASAISWSPDQRLLAAGGFRGGVLVWDAETLQERYTFATGSIWVRSIAFSSDGRRLVSVTADGLVRAWDLSTGSETQVLALDVGDWSVDWSVVSLSPNGSSLAFGGSDGRLTVYDLERGGAPRHLTGLTGQVGALTFSPDGRMLASTSDPGGGTLSLSDTVLPWEKNTVRIWDLATDQTTQAFDADTTTSCDCLVFSPDGHTLALLTYASGVVAWDIRTGSVVFTREIRCGWDSALALSPRDNLLGIWVSGSVTLVSTDERGDVLARTPARSSLALLRTGILALSSSTGLAVEFWDPMKAERVGIVACRGESNDCPVVAADAGLIVRRGWDGKLHEWTLPSLAETTLSTPNVARGPLAVSANGEMIAMMGDQNRVQLWIRRGELGAAVPFDVGTSDVISLAFSPTSLLLAVGCRDGSVRLCDPKTSTVSLLGQGHLGSASCVAFSPDGAVLASGSDDRTIKLWRVEDRMLLHTLAGHSDGITRVAFSPAGDLIASSSYDRTVRLWNARSGEREAEPARFADFCYSVAFSSDASLLAAVVGTALRVWPIEPRE